MTAIYHTAGMQIDAHKGRITNASGEHCKLRPKTFQLLLLLVRSPEAVHSKSDILSAVWSDVVVGEHVIFQSIKEIRQLFEGTEVIRTVPKQGYGWIAPVRIQPADKQTAKPDRIRLKPRLSPTFFALVGACLLLIAVLLKLASSTDEQVEGSILVLPVNIDMHDNDHDWVRLGGMDQLIQRLSSTATSGVLHTDYVLEVMSRANAPTQRYSPSDIRQIFMVSGATLAVELSLSGTPRDYQLTYQLHRRNGVDKGVLFAEHVREVIEQMAQLLATQNGIPLVAHSVDYSSGFANELIANALEAKHSHHHQKAEQLLQAAVMSEPQNLTAKRLLLEIWVESKQFEQSGPLIEDAQKTMKAMSGSTREHVRLHFWSALNQLQQQDLAGAEPFLVTAETLANAQQDWLYLAYIAEIRGQMAQYNRNYSQAEQAYGEALAFHQVLQCPHGQSNGLLNLSMLAEERGKHGEANDYLVQAMDLIAKRELTTLLPKAENWQARLEKAAAE